MDTALLRFANSSIANPALDLLMPAATMSGIVVLILWALLIERSEDAGRAWLLLASMLAAALVSVLLQNTFLRPRPTDTRLILAMPGYLSFPSGHAAVAGCTAVFLIIAGQLRRHAGWIVLALVIAVSRVYLGHHYPSDVLGGLVLGAGVAVAASTLLPGQRRMRMLACCHFSLIFLYVQVHILNLDTAIDYIPVMLRFLLPFFLIGGLSFWIRVWRGAGGQEQMWDRLLSIALPVSLVILEVYHQLFIDQGAGGLTHAVGGLAGVLIFYHLGGYVRSREMAWRKGWPGTRKDGSQ